jgi:two-component system sensor histidine kinase MprB
VAQVAELGELVTSVTALARGDDSASEDIAQGQEPEAAPGDVGLAEVVAAALAGARRDWPRAVFTADLQPCLVRGHPERLKIAVRNLLDNAAKFGPSGAPVEVRLHAGELTVRDHGPGIPPGDLPRVFDRFYRTTTARGVPGSGLGLSIVRQVAAGYGGTVEAEPAAGGGTLLRFRLPTLEPEAPRDPDATLARSAP